MSKGAESKGEISVSLGGIQRMRTHPALQVGWHKFGGVNLSDTIELEMQTGSGIQGVKFILECW